MEISNQGGGLLWVLRKAIPEQLLRVMKLTVVLLFFACLHVSARSYSQNVSFSGKNVPLETVLQSLEKQTGLSFFFNYDVIRDARLVTLDVKAVKLETVLDLVLGEAGLDYYRQGKTIFVVKRAVGAGVAGRPVPGLNPAVIEVKGRVLNEQGESLAGATVTVKGTNKTTLTDSKGEFLIKNVAPGATLEVTFLGYQKRDIAATSEDVMVRMAIASSKLDEVQVIAYGQTSQRLSTSDVTVVKAADIEKQPVTNALLALDGRVPGLFITQTTGLPGSGVTVRIDGKNSIANGNDPLYVIDGVPYISQLPPTVTNVLGTSGLSGAGAGNPMSFLNPADIESISVLKDADAISIYGSRAANGAVLITTKKGKPGPARFDVGFLDGWGAVPHKLDLMSTPQYLAMRHEAIANDGLVTKSTDYDINGTWDTTRHTDWQKVFLGGKAEYLNLNAQASGGTSVAQYLIGANYHQDGTVFPWNFSDRKGSVHFSIGSGTMDQRFHISLTGNYMIDNNNLPEQDQTRLALTTAPDAPKLYNADGSLNWMPAASGTSSWTNPLATWKNQYIVKTSNLVSNLSMDYRILPGLSIKSNLGYTSLQGNELLTLPAIAVAPESQATWARNANYGTTNVNSWIWEPQLDYKLPLGKFKINLLAGGTFQRTNTTDVQLSGSGYNNDQVLGNQASATTLSAYTDLISVYKYNAAFGRINLNWNDKYIVDLNGRRDGSSRFGPANQFHDFGSAGAAWVFSQERLFREHLQFISFGKLKGSYGIAGNDQIGDYKFLSLYSPYVVAVPYENSPGLTPTALSNPALEWEITKRLEGGAELGLIKDRILLGLVYYRNRSSNELLSYALPIITGFSSIAKNFPATVENYGWEFNLTATDVKSKNFTWSTGFNFTIANNKLLSFKNFTNSSYVNSLAIGKPITLIKAFRYRGVNSTTGVYQFADVHGNITSTPSALTDRTAYINTAPTFYGGLNNNLRWKEIELDLLFQFVQQKGANYAFGQTPGQFNDNQPTYLLSRWRKPGDVTGIQRFNSNSSLFTQYGDATSSDANYKHASYIKLKNVSLYWQLPDEWMKKVGVRTFRLYAQGQNLLTFTRYKGLDPETLSTGMPTLRVITFGAQIGL